MNSFERVTRRLAGQSVDRAPNFNIFMAYGAHAIGQHCRATIWTIACYVTPMTS